VSDTQIVDVVVLVGKYWAVAVLGGNIALMLLWWMIGPDARREAEAAAQEGLANGEMTAATYKPDTGLG
jgi:hypothetical protein